MDSVCSDPGSVLKSRFHRRRVFLLVHKYLLYARRRALNIQVQALVSTGVSVTPQRAIDSRAEHSPQERS